MIGTHAVRAAATGCMETGVSAAEGIHSPKADDLTEGPRMAPATRAPAAGGSSCSVAGASPERAALSLRIPGEPVAWARPRFNRKTGTVFNPKRQAGYAGRVGEEWIAAGRPRLLPGPYRLRVTAWLARPATHYRRGGALSAAGLRSPVPTRKPDASNLLKLVEDALVACGALPDDRFAVVALVEKRWAPTHADVALEVYATALAPEVPA